MQIAAGYSEEKLFDIFSDYYIEALRLQRKYASELNILIGTEIDWIRPSSKNFIENLFTTFQLQLFVGSVHHVHGIPIDFTAELFQEARQTSGGSDEGLFEDYFDLQHDMLEALKPPIVGHFDLIRLKSDDPDLSFVEMQGVWRKIRRNLAFIASYGGTLELNSAALRKGLEEPYPNAEISKVCFPSDLPSIAARHVNVNGRNSSPWAGNSPSPMTVMASTTLAPITETFCALLGRLGLRRLPFSRRGLQPRIVSFPRLQPRPPRCPNCSLIHSSPHAGPHKPEVNLTPCPFVIY